MLNIIDKFEAIVNRGLIGSVVWYCVVMPLVMVVIISIIMIALPVLIPASILRNLRII